MLTQGAFEKAKNYLLSRSKTDSQQVSIPRPCITLSRQTGAGADTLSNSLLDYYNNNKLENDNEWIVYDRNIIEKVIEDHHLPKAISQLLTEDKHSHIQSLMNDLLSTHSTYTLFHKTSETILQLAKLGNCIIIGRGANIITAGLNTAIHVRLVANRENRIKHIREVYEMNKRDAEEFMTKEDNARNKFMLSHFNKNIEDPINYHLVLNTSYLSIDECKGLITKLASDVIKNVRILVH